MPESAAPPLVIITEDLDESWQQWLSERCEVVRCSSDDDRFDKLLTRANALLVRTYTQVDAALLEHAPELRVVGRAGVGVDNIDVAACRARSIEVVHTPGANTRAVVELVTAFMLDAVRPRPSVDVAISAEDWKSIRVAAIGARQLSDMTMGVLGMGRVGQAMARVGAALDMRVLYNDLIEIDISARHDAQPVDIGELFEQADVLTVHIDHRAANRHFVDAKMLGLLPAGAIFINASRGFVVDARALAAWLAHDSGAKVFVDVHDPEPFGSDYPLLGCARATLTPHIGAATRSAHHNMSSVVEDVWRVLQGEVPHWRAPEV